MRDAPQDQLDQLVTTAKERLDAHTYETVQWHFHESTGCPFWLEKKTELNFDPLTEIKNYEDLRKFPLFEDDSLRGGPVQRFGHVNHICALIAFGGLIAAFGNA